MLFRSVRSTIATGDVEAALKLIEVHLMPILSEDSKHYFNEALAKIKANDMDFYTEWKLKEAVAI